jgi:hypothetical protein
VQSSLAWTLASRQHTNRIPLPQGPLRHTNARGEDINSLQRADGGAAVGDAQSGLADRSALCDLETGEGRTRRGSLFEKRRWSGG